MKKSILLTGVILLLLSLTTVSYAAHFTKSAGVSYKVIEGQVLSVNQAKGTFVVQDKDDGIRTTAYAASGQMVSLGSGDAVKVTLSRPGNRVTKIVK